MSNTQSTRPRLGLYTAARIPSIPTDLAENRLRRRLRIGSKRLSLLIENQTRRRQRRTRRKSLIPLLFLRIPSPGMLSSPMLLLTAPPLCLANIIHDILFG